MTVQPMSRSVVAIALLMIVSAQATFPGHAQSQSPEVDGPARDTVPTAVVTKRAAPRSYVVVSIPVPAALRGSESLRYEVLTNTGISLLGRRAGELAASDPEAVLVTLGVPGDALAGSAPAAVVTFSAPAGPVFLTRVDLDVAPVPKLVLTAATRLMGLYPGARLDVPVVVTNQSNFADTVAVHVQAPAGWAVEGDTLWLPLGRGASRSPSFSITVPERGSTGDFFVRVTASGLGQAPVETLVSLNVAEQPPSLTVPGPIVRTSLVAVGGAGPAAGALQIAAHGPLTAKWSVDANGSLLTGEANTNLVRGMARVGTYVTTPTLRLWSNESTLTAGNVVGSFDDLTGVNAFGQGATLAHRGTSGTALDVLVAQPWTFGSRTDGALLGARYGRILGSVDVAAGMTRLDAAPYRLDAVGVEASSGTLPFGSARAGLAWRDYGSGAGLGMSLAAQHHRNDHHLELKATHAPGGSRAFARASEELNAAASFRVSPRVDVGGSGFMTRDRNAALQSVDSWSWSLFQMTHLRAATTARVELRGSSFDATAETGAFGKSDLTLTGGLGASRGALFYAANASLARVTRRIDQEPLGLIGTTGLQAGFFGNAGWARPEGVFQADLRYDHGRPGTGYLVRQLNAGVSAERVRARVLEQGLFLDGALLYSFWGSDAGRGNLTVRAGASLPLPNDLTLALGTERNPFFRDQDGGASWVFSLRLEKAIALPRLGNGGADGEVFQDMNGDGRRADGEPGMPNVRLKRGGFEAITDAAGAYRFVEPSGISVALDVASLPAGWILPTNDRAGARDFGIVPTSRARVLLELDTTPAASLRQADLSRVDVLARDESGREWLARRSEAGVAVFDALPAGEYLIVIDAARSPEPLRVRDGEVRFRVQGGATVELKVALAGRPIRFGGSR